MIEEKLKGVNIYSFNYENYVSLQDYEKLRQRIDKAIEYIKDRCNYAFTEDDLIVNFLSKEEVTELLSILKEGRNDKK